MLAREDRLKRGHNPIILHVKLLDWRVCHQALIALFFVLRDYNAQAELEEAGSGKLGILSIRTFRRLLKDHKYLRCQLSQVVTALAIFRQLSFKFSRLVRVNSDARSVRRLLLEFENVALIAVNKVVPRPVAEQENDRLKECLCVEIKQCC